MLIFPIENSDLECEKFGLKGVAFFFFFLVLVFPLKENVSQSILSNSL